MNRFNFKVNMDINIQARKHAPPELLDALAGVGFGPGCFGRRGVQCFEEGGTDRVEGGGLGGPRGCTGGGVRRNMQLQEVQCIDPDGGANGIGKGLKVA